jgi:hypothetical protein
VHAPLRDWLRSTLERENDRLYAWTEAMLSPDELEQPALRTLHQRTVRDALDARVALGLPIESWLPERVLAWYRL